MRLNGETSECGFNAVMSVCRTAVGGRVVDPVDPSALPGAIFRIVGFGRRSETNVDVNNAKGGS